MINWQKLIKQTALETLDQGYIVIRPDHNGQRHLFTEHFHIVDCLRKNIKEQLGDLDLQTANAYDDQILANDGLELVGAVVSYINRLVNRLGLPLDPLLAAIKGQAGQVEPESFHSETPPPAPAGTPPN